MGHQTSTEARRPSIKSPGLKRPLPRRAYARSPPIVNLTAWASWGVGGLGGLASALYYPCTLAEILKSFPMSHTPHATPHTHLSFFQSSFIDFLALGQIHTIDIRHQTSQEVRERKSRHNDVPSSFETVNVRKMRTDVQYCWLDRDLSSGPVEGRRSKAWKHANVFENVFELGSSRKWVVCNG